MRAILLTAAALAALTVSGCDINTGPARTAKIDCNCAVPPPAASLPPPVLRPGYAVEPTVRHRWVRHRHGGGSVHGYGWRAEYAELSVITYDYHGGSSSYYEGGGEGHGDGYTRVEGGWVDGYGRDHGSSAGGAVHGEYAGDSAARRHPWHGYDVDCPDGAR